MTAKQWLDENNICEQSYYHWLKRIRQETYELATARSNDMPVIAAADNEVSFAEVSFPAAENMSPGESGFRPDITINTGSVIIGVSNTASDALLNKLFEVVSHAR